MKRCPACNRTYTDPSLNFCLEDGTPLLPDVQTDLDPNATIRYSTRDTYTPPGVNQVPMLNQVPERAQPQQWTRPPMAPPPRKSSAVWWILGGIAVIGVIGIGAIIMIIALASISNSNSNSNNSNLRANRNTNTNNTNSLNANSDANLPSATEDDFSQESWGHGNFSFGDIWYQDGEYHMRSKERMYLVMYAPTNSYNTVNATVRVTARSVDGTPSAAGFGLIVHGEKSKTGQLEDYALLIYPGDEAKYSIIKHKAGAQSDVVPWTESSVIRAGTNPNQLEARVKGTEITFYINGQYVDRIVDSENFRRGVAGLYASGNSEVAFDDLEINRTSSAAN